MNKQIDCRQIKWFRHIMAFKKNVNYHRNANQLIVELFLETLIQSYW